MPAGGSASCGPLPGLAPIGVVAAARLCHDDRAQQAPGVSDDGENLPVLEHAPRADGPRRGLHLRMALRTAGDLRKRQRHRAEGRGRQGVFRPHGRHDVHGAGPQPSGADRGDQVAGGQAGPPVLLVFQSLADRVRRTDCEHASRRPEDGQFRGHGLRGQRDRHADGARRHRALRHRVGHPRPAWRQPGGRGRHQRRRGAARRISAR